MTEEYRETEEGEEKGIERRENTGNINELFKRKKEKMEIEKEEKMIFEAWKKLQRSLK